MVSLISHCSGVNLVRVMCVTINEEKRIDKAYSQHGAFLLRERVADIASINEVNIELKSQDTLK